MSTGRIQLDERARLHLECDEASMTLADLISRIRVEDRGTWQARLLTFEQGSPSASDRTVGLSVLGAAGEWRHLELTLGSVSDSELVCASKDVTRDRRAAWVLHRANRDLERAQKIGRIGSWRLEIDSGRLEWSEQTYRIFGVPIESRVDLDTFSRCIHPDDRATVELAWQSALSGKPYDLLHRIVVNGNVKWIHEHAEIDNEGSSGRVAHGIAQDVTVSKNMTDELRESQMRFRALVERVEHVREDERTRIAREIHDELGQIMTALKMELAWVRSQLLHDQPQVIARIDQMSAKIDDSVRTVRRIAHELRPAVLDTLGLPAAVEGLAIEFSRRVGIRCGVSVTPEPLEISALAENGLFRIAQELLTNVGRHSGASRVDVKLHRQAEDVVLEVADNGRGVREEVREHDSLGMLGIRERVAQLGGRLSVGSLNDSGGTRIAVTIPRSA